MHLDEPIDLAFLAAQTVGDRGLEADLLALFLRQVDEVAAELSVPRPEARKLADTLHRIKGSARAIGAGPLAGAADRVEDVLRASAGATPREATASLQAFGDALQDARAFAASRLGAIRQAGLAKPPESR